MPAIMPAMIGIPGKTPPANTPVSPGSDLQASRALALASTLSLVALGLAWELWLAPTGRGTWALKVLPLLPALPGLWRYRLYTYRWLSLLVWLYVAEGLVRAGSEAGTGRLLAAGQVALGLALFSACVLQVRRRLKGRPIP
ncbi:MAG: DUF2069 domain-containing protein [Vitreoscilla sp.]|nr:DUF2069 domain-containing protein [Vitreoscilla sp.]